MDRTYNLADAELFSFATGMIAELQQNIGDFSELSPKFSISFISEFRTKYDEAFAIPSDDVMIDRQAKASADVEEHMALCRKKYNQLKFFVEEAFPKQEQIRNEFGFNDYAKARAKEDEMQLFLRNFVVAARNHSKELEAVYFGESKIIEIEELRKELESLTTAKRQAKTKRNQATYERVNKLNALHEIMRTVEKASAIIYENNPTKHAPFSIPTSTSSSQNKNVETKSIPAGQSVEIKLEENKKAEIINSGKKTIYFLQTDAENATLSPSNTDEIAPGDSVILVGHTARPIVRVANFGKEAAEVEIDLLN